MTRRGLAELIAIVAPPACAACREPLRQPDALLCPDCLRALPWLRGRRCPRCALPRHRSGGCPAASAAYSSAWAPMAYEGSARAIVRALKFNASLPLAAVMAAQIAATLPSGLRAGTIVPAPAQAARRRARGFDPARLLAAALAERLGAPLAPVLARADRAGPQARAGRRARRAGGRLVIAASALPPRGPILLVDDVHTTGATLDACARALRAAGTTAAVGPITAVTYARTL